MHINKEFKIIKIIKVILTNQGKERLFIPFLYMLITR